MVTSCLTMAALLGASHLAACGTCVRQGSQSKCQGSSSTRKARVSCLASMSPPVLSVVTGCDGAASRAEGRAGAREVQAPAGKEVLHMLSGATVSTLAPRERVDPAWPSGAVWPWTSGMPFRARAGSGQRELWSGPHGLLLDFPVTSGTLAPSWEGGDQLPFVSEGQFPAVTPLHRGALADVSLQTSG